MAWLLRLNPYDPGETEAVVLDDCTALARSANYIASVAAGYLLKALATPRAMDIATTQQLLPPSSLVAWRSPRTKVINGTIDWSAETNANESDSRSLDRLRELADYAVDPDVKLRAGSEKLIRDCAAMADVDALWRTVGVTESDHAFDNAAPVLARWAPDALADLLRKVYRRGSSRSAEAVGGLASALRGALLVLGEDEIRVI